MAGMSRIACAAAAAVAALALAGEAGASILPCGLLSKCPPPKPPPAPPPVPPPSPPVVYGGAEYDGHAGEHWRITLNVAQNKTGLTAFQFLSTRGRCSDGARYASSGAGRIQHGAVIDAGGGGSYTRVLTRAHSFTRHGVRVSGHEQVSLSFHFQGDRVQGVLRDRFRSKRLSCASERVTFTAYRDGTPQAPIATSSVATGRYAGTTSHSNAVFMRVFVPQDLIVTASFVFKAPACTGGLTLGGSSRFTFDDVAIRGDRFSAVRRGFYLDRNGFGDRYVARLSGVLHRTSNGRYYARGTWRYSDAISRAGRQLGICATPSRDRFTLAGPRATAQL